MTIFIITYRDGNEICKKYVLADNMDVVLNYYKSSGYRVLEIKEISEGFDVDVLKA